MNLNPFLAALGGAFRGAAMDTEMQRRLQEAEAERKRIERADKLRDDQFAWSQKKAEESLVAEAHRQRRVREALMGIGASDPEAEAASLDPTVADIVVKKYTAPKPVPDTGFDSARGVLYRKDTGETVADFGPAPEKGMTPYEAALIELRNRELRNRDLAKQQSPRGKALPASAVEKLGAYDALEAMTQDVKFALENAVKNKRDITGRAAGGYIKTPSWWKNQAPEFLGGKPVYKDADGRDIGVDARAMMGNLYATLAKERGGTALSANEIRLLESYLPNENEEEATAALKAGRFLKELRRLKAAKLSAYQQYGFGVDDNLPIGDQPIGKRPTANDLWENP